LTDKAALDKVQAESLPEHAPTWREILKPLKVTVLGAGPIGLEAALYSATLGHDVTILEQGHIAENLSRWGHVTLFSPWRMNHTPLAKQALEGMGWRRWPELESFQTGLDYLAAYLIPLSSLPVLRGRIFERHRVVALGKEGLLKGEKIGDSERLSFPFRILVATPAGERVLRADRVLDATGTYGRPNCLGCGGIPAPGEREASDHISYALDDPLGKHRETYAGRRILLVGCGYSAATSLLALQQLVKEAPQTSVVWATRSRRAAPYAEIEADPLAGRRALIQEANRVAGREEPGIRRLAGREVGSIARSMGGGLEVRLLSEEGEDLVTVDRILANVGYQPDRGLYSELQVHECYASSGPMKLAAALLSAGGSDCLALGGQGAETLMNPEPGFFIVGSKSYGRNSSFLLSTGYEQIRDVFRLLERQPDLDLYANSVPIT